jgi:hypothetical protein
MTPLTAPLLLALALGVLAAGVGVLRGRRGRRWLRWSGGLGLLGLGAIGALVAGYGTWFFHRGQPEPLREDWFAGVRYERLVLQQPRRMVAHLVRIDLTEPGIDFLVTPAQPTTEGDVLADTTRGFAARHGVQLAINAHFFYPFHANSPLDYQPRVGEPVHIVGKAASRGTVYGKDAPGTVTLYLSRNRRVSFEQPLGEPWQALSGLGYVLRDGVPVAQPGQGASTRPYPRTAIAIDATGRTLLLLVVDGKQRGYSEGATLAEVADLLVKHGGHTGLQLDGGGSATLVRREASGRVRLINSLSNFRLPWWERPVATSLGVHARPLTPPP